MKDKKRKYDLSYFIKDGARSIDTSPSVNASEMDPEVIKKRNRNLQEELEKLEAAREAEREKLEAAREAEREEQQLQGLLKASGVSSKEFDNFVIQTAKTTASSPSTRAAASATLKAPENSRKKENKPNLSFAKSTLKGISKTEKEAEKQKQRSNERIAQIRAENEAKQKQRLAVIASIMQENGLTDASVILIKDLYCSNKEKYNELFENFFKKKFLEYFKEIDELKQNNSLTEKISDKALELLAYNRQLSLVTSSLKLKLAKFGEIFRNGTEFDTASNGLFKEIHDHLNKLRDKSELNFKDLEKVLGILYTVQEWIKVTYGQNLEIQIDSKPTPSKLQTYLNTLLKILGEKNKELGDFNTTTFKKDVEKRATRLLLKYAEDKLIGLLLDPQQNKKFKQIIEELIDLDLFSKENLDEIYKIIKNSEEEKNEEIAANLTAENKKKEQIRLKFEKNEKNRAVRAKIGSILAIPQEKILAMLGHLLEYYKTKPQAGGNENANASSTVNNKENWENAKAFSVPTKTKTSWRNVVVSAEKARKEKEKAKEAEEAKAKAVIQESKNTEKKFSENRIKRYLNNKGNEKYRDLVNPKITKVRRQELSFPNFPNSSNSSNRQFMNTNNSQILRRNNTLNEPNNAQKFSTISKIIAQIKAKKLKKEKKIVELVKRLNKPLRQNKINKITERINRLSRELKNQEEDNNQEENNNNDKQRNNLVLMISPTQRISDLTVTISGKKIILKNIIDVYENINILFGQIFLVQTYKDRINELKDEILSNIQSNNSFTFEHKISELILDLLNEHGYPNLFIDQFLGLNNLDTLIDELINILKDNLCKIIEKQDYLPDKHFRNIFERVKQKVLTEASREIPKLITAFQSKNVSNQVVEQNPFFQQLLRIQNSSAQRNSPPLNSNSNNLSAQRNSPALNNSSAQRNSPPLNSNSNNLSAQSNSPALNSNSNSSAKSRALTVATVTNKLLFNPNPELPSITPKQIADIQAEIEKEKKAITKEQKSNQKKALKEVLKGIKSNINRIKLEGYEIPTKLAKAIRKRIESLNESSGKLLIRELDEKLEKLSKEIDEKKAAEAAKKVAAEAATKAAKKAAKKAPKVSRKNKNKKDPFLNGIMGEVD